MWHLKIISPCLYSNTLILLYIPLFSCSNSYYIWKHNFTRQSIYFIDIFYIIYLIYIYFLQNLNCKSINDQSNLNVENVHAMQQF